MRAVRCSDKSVEVVDLPAPVGEGVRVKVISAGICGSDLHLLKSDFQLPYTLGHELAGELDNGQQVAIEPISPCGECDCCQRGDYNLCQIGPSMIYGSGRDGGMAEQVLVPERALVPLPTGVSAKDACLVEPLAVAEHGLRLADVRSQTRVAVIGGGSIGLCAIAAISGRGSRPLLVARHDGQREAGAKLGGLVGGSVGTAGADESRYDVVIDAAGTPSALAQALQLCRPGGTLLLLATYWDGFELPGFLLCLKEIRIVPASMYGTSGGTRDIERAAALMAGNPEIAKTLITHRFPLEAAQEAFAAAADRSGGAIKVLLEP